MLIGEGCVLTQVYALPLPEEKPVPIAKKQPEQVDHPSHYNTGKIEVIDAIEDWGLGFHEGNVVKYVARARHKGKELEDLKKARWYLDRLISEIEKRDR